MKYFTYENYMRIVGPLGNLMFYLQAYEIFSKKAAISVSIPGFILSFIGVSSWLLYGILLKNKPLIIANMVGIIGAAMVLIGVLLYCN